jgi:hypothetical protein
MERTHMSLSVLGTNSHPARSCILKLTLKESILVAGADMHEGRTVRAFDRPNVAG